MRTARRRSEEARANQPGTVLLFTGVRYERTGETATAEPAPGEGGAPPDHRFDA